MECSVNLDNVKDFITSDKFTHFLLAETTDFGTAAFILQTLMDRVAELENSEDDLLDEEE